MAETEVPAATPTLPSERTKRIRLVAIAAALVLVVGLAIPAITIGLPWWSDGHLAPARTTLAAGRAHTCAIVADGSVKCWGANESGQLGNGTVESSAEPVPVTGVEKTVSLASAGNHTCALTSAGAVWCWGDNLSGQLGDGSTELRPVPVAVQGLAAGVLAVATSGSHSCALLGDRSVSCWGENGSGQLGTGDTTSSLVPVPVKDLPARSTAVAVGAGFSCVGFTGRTVRCWGDNSDGQLGVGAEAQRLSWEPVAGLPRTSILSAGEAHVCVITGEGTVMCWGSNSAGQLGITVAAPSAPAPLALPNLSGRYRFVTTGYNATCAIDESGELSCWGGEPNDPSIDPSAPRFIALDGVQQATTGVMHTCAQTDSGVYCWGRNDAGQLGPAADGISTDPVHVDGL